MLAPHAAGKAAPGAFDLGANPPAASPRIGCAAILDERRAGQVCVSGGGPVLCFPYT